jgi:pyruvate/2-oxoglutarate dehydrogenase complex dihydrolipoamide dehydrogenase (E3) component
MNEIEQSDRKDVQPEIYDLVVLGSGEGSKYLAWSLADQGKTVAVVERKYVGGSCPNIACLPSKNIIFSAKVASLLRRREEFGLLSSGFEVDMGEVRERKRKMVSELVDLHVQKFKSSGAELILGAGRFVDACSIQVDLHDGSVRTIRGRDVVIGTGTTATVEPIPGLREAKPLTHIGALDLGEIPDHLIVVGAGYVGMEISHAMRRFGSRVTIVDTHDRLSPKEDQDISEALQTLSEEEGIELALGVNLQKVEGQSGTAVKVFLSEGSTNTVLTGTHIMVAMGRTPNTQNLGLQCAGIELTDSGYIKVNEKLQTSVPHVWAMGECAGSPAFTHIAYDDFRVVSENISGGKRSTIGRQVPSCVFTDPEFARVGLTEIEAKSKSIPYRLFKIPASLVLRTRTLGETKGFLKALVSVETDEILGFSAFCVNAGELLAPLQLAMSAKLPYTSLRDAIFAHPTMQEGLVVLFSTKPVRSP